MQEEVSFCFVLMFGNYEQMSGSEVPMMAPEKKKKTFLKIFVGRRNCSWCFCVQDVLKLSNNVSFTRYSFLEDGNSTNIMINGRRYTSAVVSLSYLFLFYQSKKFLKKGERKSPSAINATKKPVRESMIVTVRTFLRK